VYCELIIFLYIPDRSYT